MKCQELMSFERGLRKVDASIIEEYKKRKDQVRSDVLLAWSKSLPDRYFERGEIMKRKCISLKQDEQVVFNIYSDIYERKIPMVGSVIDVYSDRKVVVVSWLEGHKDRKDFIPFSDMLAVYNPDGERMNFENISGKSDVLIPE